VATERETRMCERVRHIENVFKARQVALDLRVPYPTGHAFEE
jgi:hypothetical protein